MVKLRLLTLALALIFGACASPTPQITQSKISEDELKLILIKSQNIRFYDFGTLSVEGAESSVDCYSENCEAIEETQKNNLVILSEAKNLKENNRDSSVVTLPQNDNKNIPAESSAKIPQKIELKVFKLGKFLGAFVITKKEICYISAQNSADCAPKWMANKSFFGKVSYDSLMEEILLRRDIFEGQGKRLGAGGAVIQEFSFGGEKIYYERSSKRTYFKNFTNGVIVSIEDYKK